MSEAWDRIEGLPLRVESYELSAHDREYGSFTRPSTVIHLRGDGQEGVGEDVVYDVLDHIAHRDAGPTHDFTGVATLGEFCELTGRLDLFATAAPGMPASRLYRRWAFESAALDLALRQAGVPLHEALGRDPKPLQFVCSTRLTSFDGEAGSSTEPISKRLAKYPGLQFKLDPENDWTPELIAEIKELATVRVLDLKGHYRGTPVDVDTDPELYRQVAEAFPEAYLEDPDVNDETATAARAAGRSRHLGRPAALARRHQGPGMDPEGDQLEAVPLRLAAGDPRDLRVLRRAGDQDLRRRPG